MLNLDKSFHADSSLREITTGVTNAIEKVIGSSKIIRSGTSTFCIFNLILMFIPLFADILIALLNSKSEA
uniref:Uncharacterized protein n=1 Tax=Acrobeloides nanus TaxID=290746 RepID=A0A914DD80_9BILA